MIKAIQNWFAIHFATIIGIIGIILTLLLGVFYIPHRLRATKIEKVNHAQKAIEQSVKELTFSDSPVNFLEIKFLIEAKEIQLNETFPLSMTEVLTLAQQSFMNDKFLPLERRKELVKKLEDLKATVPAAYEETAKKKNRNFWTGTTIGAVLSIVVSILTALLGAFSLYKKEQKEVENSEELANEVAQNGIAMTIQKQYADEMENKFLSVLKNIQEVKMIDYSKNTDDGVAVHFSYKNKEYFVAFKFLTHTKIGLSGIRPFLNSLNNKQGEIWLLYNTDLTAMAKQEIKNLNERHSDKEFKVIKISSVDEFKKVTERLLQLT